MPKPVVDGCVERTAVGRSRSGVCFDGVDLLGAASSKLQSVGMKRGASDAGGGASPGHPAKLQKTASDQGKGSDGDNGGPDSMTILQQQNHELAIDMRRRQRQEAELEKKLAQAWAQQGHFDATLSAVNRAWNQVLSDLTRAAGELGLGPRPLTVDANEEEGELQITVKDGLTVSSEGGEPATELAIMQKLLLPAAEVLGMDATDSSCGDRLLKDMGKNPEKSEDPAGSARELLGCMAGTSAAFYDLDSDGFGMTSQETVKTVGEAKISELEKRLQEKARYTAEFAGRLFQALQAHLMSLPPESRKQTIDKSHAEMVGEKKRLQAETAFLGDQLIQARKRCIELSESVTSLREDYRKANRTLDRLAEEGVELPSDNNASTWANRGGNGGQRGGSGGGGMSRVSLGGAGSGNVKSEGGMKRGGNSSRDPEELLAALEQAQALSETRQKEMERCRAEKADAENELTQFKASTQLDPERCDLSGHPQFQRLSTQLEAEQDMLKLERTRVAELETQIKEMSIEVEQHEMALPQQMEQQRLRWKSEIVSSNSMLNAAHEELEKTQTKLKYEKSVGTGMLVTATTVRDEVQQLLAQTEQQVSILKANLERATRAKEHAEAQAAKDRSRLERQAAGASTGGREDEILRGKLQDALRQLEGSKAVEDALQSELNTTLVAYAQSKESNQKLIQEMNRISASQQELSDEVAATKQQLKNRQQVRATMELQVKTAAQMRDQGHALKQKALEFVADSDEKVRQIKAQNLELAREVHTEKAHADRARQEVDAVTQVKRALEAALSALKEHSVRLNQKVVKLEEELERAKEQVVTLTRKLEKCRIQNAKLVEQVEESANNPPEDKIEDNEMRDAELAELRKMIKCSVCQDKKKNRVITKCFHMFCDACIDKSIKSRNRKCPACTKTYGLDDIHELWLT